MKIINEFKEFAVKGNVIDLAVGVIIGSAFGKIVTSLVNDVIMPPIGALTGGVDFSNKVLVIKQATESTRAINLNWGLFVNNVIDFLIVAVVIFLVIKQVNKLKRKQESVVEEKPSQSEELTTLKEIRDLLKR